MPQKKAPRQNSYFFFMRDFKRREEAKGVRFPLGLKDVSTFASDEWKNLPQYEKDRYKQMAEEYNKSDQRAQGISAIGIKTKPKPLMTPSMRLSFKERKKVAENNYIKTLVQNMDPDQLLDHLFYLMHVNIYCKTDDDEYIPAEIAISRFTLRNGALKVFHRFLNPGEIPMGYSYAVKVHSEKTHRIPLDIMTANKGYLGMYQSILNFLQEGNPSEIPPLYTMIDEPFHNCSMSAVKQSLKRIWETQNVEMEEDGEICDDEPYEKIFKVYSLPRLLFELKNRCAKLFNTGPEFTNTSLANLELLKDVYSFDEEIACSFHKESDNVQFCSQSYTVRWTRVIRNLCCKDFVDDEEEEEEEEETVPEIPPKDEKVDLPVKNELPITTEDIKTERESRVKTEKDRGYGDTSRVKTERDRGYERHREDDRVKSEKDRGYDDRSRNRRDDDSIKCERDRGYGDRRSQRDDDVRIKTERDRGYDDRSRHRDDRVKSERDRGYDDRVKSERDRGYDDRRSRRDDDVRVKSERDRGYDDRGRHRDDRIKSERDRGYDNRREESSRRSSPEILPTKTEKDRGYENATAREQPSTSNAVNSERKSSTESAQVRVKTENPLDYYDSILKTEHVDIPYIPEPKVEQSSYENTRDPRNRKDTQPSRDPRVQNAQAVSRDPRMRAAQAVPPQPEVPSSSRIPSPVPVKQEKPYQAESSRLNSQKSHDIPLPIKVVKTEEPPASHRSDEFPKNDFPLPKQIKTEKTEKSVSPPTQKLNDFPLPIKTERPETQAASSKSNSISEPVRIKTERSLESSRSHDFPLPIPIKEERSPEPRSRSHGFPLLIQIKTERPESSQALQNTKMKTEPPSSSASESQKRKFVSDEDHDAKRHQLHGNRHELVKNEMDYDECPPTPRRDEWCPPTPRRDECPPTPRRDEWCPPTPRRDECPPTPRRDDWCPPTPRREDFPDQQSTRIKSEPPDTYEIKQEEVHVESDGTTRVVKPERNSHPEPMDCDWDLPMEGDDAGGNNVIKEERSNNQPTPEKVKEEKIPDNVIIKDEMFHSHEDVD